MSYRVIGEVTDKAAFEYGNVSITLDEALKTWDAALEDVFPTESDVRKEEVKNEVFKAENVVICNHKIALRPYSFRYSREQTASTTARRHLSVRVQRSSQRYLRT